MHCRQATIQATTWEVWNQADRQQSEYGIEPRGHQLKSYIKLIARRPTLKDWLTNKNA